MRTCIAVLLAGILGLSGCVRGTEGECGVRIVVREEGARSIDAGETQRIVFDSSGRFLATIGGGQLRLWDLASGDRVHVPSPSLDAARDVAFCPRAPWFVVVTSGDESQGPRLSVRAAPDWQERWGFAFDDSKWPTKVGRRKGFAVTVTPDASRVIAGVPDGFIYVCDARTGNLYLRFKAHMGGINSVAADPGGERVISAGFGVCDRTLRAWNLDTGTQIEGFFPPEHDLDIAPPGITKIQFAPDGRLYALRFELRVWDVRGGSARLAAVIRYSSGMDEEDSSAGHISSFDIDPLGRYLATGHHDHTIAIRDLRDGVVLREWRAHRESQQYMRIAWAPGGQWLASAASRDRFLRLWPVERQECGR